MGHYVSVFPFQNTVVRVPPRRPLHLADFIISHEGIFTIFCAMGNFK